MSYEIPFLRPNLPRKEDYLHYLDQIDHNRLYSNYGPLNHLFERRIEQEYFAGTGAAVTVANATIGLMLAISKLKRPRGRYALMPSFTFAATPLAAQWCGLEPYFIDIRPDDWCLDEEMLARTIQDLGEKIAVVVPYATFGTALDLTPYDTLHRAGIPVVVDAAPCFGTFDQGSQFGLGFPGAVVFSFHATKAFGVGEGGLIYSGDPEIIEAVRRAANFGFSAHRESECQGMNGKMSEYTAAVALATLDAFPRKIEVREDLHQQYNQQFRLRGLIDRGWDLQKSKGRIPHQFQPALCPLGLNRDNLLSCLEKNRVQGRSYFSPVCHQQEQFHHCPKTDLATTEEISSRVISLPLWEEMNHGHIHRVIDVIEEVKGE